MAAGTGAVGAHKGYDVAAEHTTEEFQLFPCQGESVALGCVLHMNSSASSSI